MSLMFGECKTFNQILENWDLKNIEKYGGLKDIFLKCDSLQILPNWLNLDKNIDAPIFHSTFYDFDIDSTW